MTSELAKKTLDIAILQLGEHEEPKGSNAGHDIEEFLKSVGLGPGYPWCMAFIYFCVNEAAKELGVTNPLKKTGGVLVQYNSRPLLRVNVPQVGDILILDYGKGKGHTGIIWKIEGGVLYTIEGNTNDEGSREGYEVAKMIRRANGKQIKGFLRL